ncbi:MAG: sigma-70 family RNA polymerase sigma factor, partial [Clostridia bacterium]|nr:sigma-70 family RNA polymerase sigma factor [Clostridia bacterium]
MDKNYAEKIVTEYLKPIYGFALKRCKTEADAEDLSQEIVLRAYRALCIRDDIDNIGKFIWAIAHNTLANYYRDGARQFVGVSIDEIAEIISDGSDDLSAEMIHRETC